LFRLFKKEEKNTGIVHNRLVDIRVGRQYARGNNMNGNTYECFKNTAEEVYNRSIESSDDLTNVDKECFIEGYNAQTEELVRIVNK